MSSTNSKTITKQIAKTQDKVNSYLLRVEMLEKKLRSQELSMEERIRLEDELTAIKEGILKSENNLKQLYGENRKTMIFVVLLMFLSFLFYSLYVMIYGPKLSS